MKKQNISKFLCFLFLSLTVSCAEVEFTDISPKPPPIQNQTPAQNKTEITQKMMIISPTVSTETSKFSYFIKNNSNKDLFNFSLDLINPEFSILNSSCPMVFLKNETCEIIVKYQPISSGRSESTILLKDSSIKIGELKVLGLNEYFSSNLNDFINIPEIIGLSRGDNSVAYSSLDFSLPNNEVTIDCGDVITQSIKIANDLDCQNEPYALSVEGDGIVIYGNGKKITGVNTVYGVSVDGKNNILIGMNISGFSTGYAISGYNVTGLRVLFSHFKNNLMALRIFNDSLKMENIVFSGNTVKDGYSGLSASASGVELVQPKIVNNNLSNNSIGFILSTESFSYSQDNNNMFFIKWCIFRGF